MPLGTVRTPAATAAGHPRVLSARAKAMTSC